MPDFVARNNLDDEVWNSVCMCMVTNMAIATIATIAGAMANTEGLQWHAHLYFVGTVPHSTHDQWLGEYVLDDEPHNSRPMYSLVTPTQEAMRSALRKAPRGFAPEAVLRSHTLTGQWIIGTRSQVATNQGWAAVYDNASTPSDITGVWHVHVGGRGWLPAPELRIATGAAGEAAAVTHEAHILAKAAAAPTRVLLHGATPNHLQAAMLGEYVRVVDVLCDRRPVYELVDLDVLATPDRQRIFLRYCSANGQWMVGTEGHVGTDLGFMYAANAMAWHPADIASSTARRIGKTSARNIGQWKVIEGQVEPLTWHDAPELHVLDLDIEDKRLAREAAEREAELRRRARMWSLITPVLVVGALVLLAYGCQEALRWGRERREAREAEELRKEKRRQRRAVDKEVRQFEKSLGLGSFGTWQPPRRR